MKILCISDIHGQFGDYKVAELPDADTVLVAGDLTDWGLRGEAKGYGEMNRARAWLRLMGERYNGVFWIPCNHDIGVNAYTFADVPNIMCVLHQTIRLFDHGSAVSDGAFSLFGVSQTTCFGHPDLKQTWDYMTDSMVQDAAAFEFPPVSIVLSHGPPTGVLDGPENWGSPGLRVYIERNKPRLVVCGHIHEDGGKQEMVGETLVVNCACVPMLIDLAE